MKKIIIFAFAVSHFSLSAQDFDSIIVRGGEYFKFTPRTEAVEAPKSDVSFNSDFAEIVKYEAVCQAKIILWQNKLRATRSKKAAYLKIKK